jgi:hypothetical protein
VQTNARLVDTASAAQIWGDRFENEFADFSELQEHIASAKSRRSWLSNLYRQRTLCSPDAVPIAQPTSHLGSNF